MVQELKCPKCGSTHIVDTDCFDTSVMLTKAKFYYTGYCQNCDTFVQWAECYTFEGYDEIEEN